MLRRNGMLKSEAAGWDMLEAVRGSVEQQELEEVAERKQLHSHTWSKTLRSWTWNANRSMLKGSGGFHEAVHTKSET